MRDPQAEIAELQSQSLLRTMRPVETAQASHITIHGKQLTNFASNDYLGLAHHPAIEEASIAAIKKWGNGSGASRLICGSLPPHRQLEQYIASSKDNEAALTFANGYSTALGTLSALCTKKDTIILDKLSHASLIDGARLSGATLRIFPHNDLAKLEKLLHSTKANACSTSRTLIVTESVFSMDGDLAPLKEIITLKNKYNALLLVDEAHGLGIYGETGMGLAEHLQCSDGIDFQMGTLGKAVGSAGGYIAASQDFITLMVNKSRSFIYSTAPPPSQTAAALEGLRIIQSQEGAQRRKQLWDHCRLLSQLTQTPMPTSAIIPWHIGDSNKALALSQSLQEKQHILAPAIRFPTVPRKTERLRITLNAQHSVKDIHTLCAALLP